MADQRLRDLLAERHLLKALARELYEDRTPPPSPEEVELRRLTRLARAWAARSPEPMERTGRATSRPPSKRTRAGA